MSDLSPTSSTDTNQVFAAFAKAQSNFEIVEKEGESNRGKFATFPALVAHVKPILSAEDLFFTQLAVPSPHGAVIVTRIGHASGQWFSDSGTLIPAAKLDPQGAGASYSFARRYGLQAVCGIATDEDNGKAATEAIQREQQEAARAAAAKVEQLSMEQRAIITAIAVPAGITEPDFTGKLAADYGDHLRTALQYALKQKVLDVGDADDVQRAGLALDLAAVEAAMKGGAS